jgi:hypothetical protein
MNGFLKHRMAPARSRRAGRHLISHTLAVGFSIFILAACSRCSNSIFFSVQMPDYGETACTPDMGELSPQSEPGIRIAAPGKIDLGQHDVFPLCGRLRFKPRFKATLEDDAVEATVVTVVDKDRNISFSFNLEPPGKLSKEEDTSHKGPSPDDIEDDGILENYFNVDLLIFSDDLRQNLQPGRYEVQATLGPFKSNTVEIKVTDSSEEKK